MVNEINDLSAEPTNNATPDLPPVKIAFVIDGKVVDVLHTDERLAAIFLSTPTIVDVTDWVAANPSTNLVDATYDGTTFTPEEL